MIYHRVASHIYVKVEGIGDMPQRVKGMKCNYIPTARQFVKQQRLRPLCAAIFLFSSPGSSGRGYWGRNGTIIKNKEIIRQLMQEKFCTLPSFFIGEKMFLRIFLTDGER